MVSMSETLQPRNLIGAYTSFCHAIVFDCGPTTLPVYPFLSKPTRRK